MSGLSHLQVSFLSGPTCVAAMLALGLVLVLLLISSVVRCTDFFRGTRVGALVLLEARTTKECELAVQLSVYGQNVDLHGPVSSKSNNDNNKNSPAIRRTA